MHSSTASWTQTPSGASRPARVGYQVLRAADPLRLAHADAGVDRDAAARAGRAPG